MRLGRVLPIVPLVAVSFVAAVLVRHTEPARASFPGGNAGIAYTSSGSVFVANPDGTDPREIVHADGARSATFSPDGTKIAYISSSSSGILKVVSATGGTPVVVGTGGYTDPAWSPDGTEIVVGHLDMTTFSGDLQVLRVSDGSVVKTIPAQPNHGYERPTWRPSIDTTEIAAGYSAFQKGPDQAVIQLVHTNGTTGAFGATTVASQDGQYDWSPDGQRLAYHESCFSSATDCGGGHRYVVSANADGTNRTVVDADVPSGEGIAYSPDGTKLAYANGTSLTVAPLGGGAKTTVPISSDSDISWGNQGALIVNDTRDIADAAPGDGICDVDTTTDGAQCTLRAAIMEADTRSALTRITFDLPSTDLTIRVGGTGLPVITKAVDIDGRTNRGGLPTLDGTNAGSTTAGLQLQGPGSKLRGLAVDHFGGPGVSVNAASVTIGGNPTGEDPCAYPCLTAAGNGGPGVSVVGVSTQVLIQGVRLTADKSPAIDLGGDGRTANDANDADTGPNGKLNFPVGVLGSTDPVTRARSVGGLLDPRTVGNVVDVYAQPSVEAARGAEPALFVGSTTVAKTGAFVLSVPASIPVADDFYSATTTAPGSGTSELSPICGDPDGDGNPDSDGDGLCDDWELHGIDGDGDGTPDLPLNDATFAANPTKKDLYLEIDAMRAPGRPHPFVLQRKAEDEVVAAFADAPVDGGKGVALHVNPGVSGGADDADIPEDDTISEQGLGTGTEEGVRDGSLSAPCDGDGGTAAERASANCYAILVARRIAFRYALAGYAYEDGGSSSGVADGIGGDMLLITLGTWSDGSILFNGGGLARCGTYDGCRTEVEAGTLMHEFGHLLGLYHGGAEDHNFKPNYLSIMSYLYQTRGLDPTRPLDYSRQTLPTLDELALDERTGILGPPSAEPAATRADVLMRWPKIAWIQPVPRSRPAACAVFDASPDGPIDWDRSGTTGTTGASIDRDKKCQPSDLVTTGLTSPDDWDVLHYDFRTEPGTQGVAPAGSTSDDDPDESAELVALGAHSDVDGNGSDDLADACRDVPGSGLPDVDHNGYVDACDPTLASLHAYPAAPPPTTGTSTTTPSSSTTTPPPSSSSTTTTTTPSPPPPGPTGTDAGGVSTDAGASSTDTTTTPPPGLTRPTLTKLGARPSTARRATRTHRRVTAAVVRYTLSGPATVTLTLQRVVAGHRKGRTCSTRVRRGKRCQALVTVKGAQRLAGVAGANELRFAGTLGHRKLAPGAYVLTLVAVSPGGASAPATVTLTVR